MEMIEKLKSRLEDIDNEISELKSERYEIEDKIDRVSGYEELEPVVIAAMNRNYNHWCSLDYLAKNLIWEDTDIDPEDEDKMFKIVAACELLVEKGIAQRKETGSYDDDLDPICDYRITDTETPDMFGRNEGVA